MAVEWNKRNRALLRVLWQEERKSLEEVAEFFGTTPGAIKRALNRFKIYRSKPRRNGERERKTKLRRRVLNERDLAHRLMVLQGLEPKEASYDQSFTDEQLLAWVGDIQRFCRDLLIYNGAPLELQDYQLKMVEMWERHRYSIVCAGRQVGKSLTVAAYALWKCITVPNTFVVIVSPTERQSKELFRRIIEFCAYNDMLYESVVDPKSDEVKFTNGGRIVSLPGRGAITGYTGVDIVIVDEAGLPELPDKVFSDVVPMLLAKHGKLILLGTPRGKTTRFYEYWNSPLFAKLHVPTRMNKKLPNLNEFLESERRRCTVVEYQQEYEGVFMDMESAFIPSRYIDAAIEDYEYALQKDPRRRYYCGVDWGRFSDQTVIVVVSTRAEEVRVEYIKAFSGEPLQKARAHIEYLDSIFGFEKIVVEYNGLSIPIVDEMRGANVVKWTTNNQNKFEGFSNLRKLFEDGRITIPAHESRLITQLRYLEMSQTDTGKFRIRGAGNRHDDYCMALMLACTPLMKKKRQPYVSWVF